MAGNSSKIYIEVEVDGKGGIKVLRQIGTESEKTAKKGKKSFQDMGRSTGDFNKQISMTRKLVGGMGVLFAGMGLGRLIGEMKEWVALAEVQRKSVAGMETAMKSMGRYTPEFSGALQDYAASLQQVSNFGDEATLQGVKFMMTYRDITDDLMPRSMRVMQDLAALMKGDVVGAANMLGKASIGMTGELRRAGITVDSATFKSQGYLGVLKQIEQQVSGQAAAMRDPWIQLDNVISDTKETLGGMIGVAFRPYAEDMIALLPELSKSWRELADSIRETQRVELEYEIRKIRDELAGKGTVMNLPGTMAFDFTITGMSSEEEAALLAKLNRLQNRLEEIRDSASRVITPPPPAGTPGDIYKTQAYKEMLANSLAVSTEYAHEEYRMRSKYSELTAADIAVHETLMSDFKKAQIDKSNAAYAAAYDYLQFKTDDYYNYRLVQIQRETDAIAAATGDQVLAHQVYIERVKELDADRLAVARDSNKHLIELSQRTAEAMEQNFSDFYFDVMRGEFNSLEDYATGVLRSIQRATADVMGQMTKEALYGKSSGGGLIDLGVGLLGSWLGGGSTAPSTIRGGQGGGYGFDRGGYLGEGVVGVGTSSGKSYEFHSNEVVLPAGNVSKGGGDVSIQVNVINNGEPVEQSAPADVRFDGKKYIADVHIDRLMNSRAYRQSNRQAMR